MNLFNKVKINKHIRLIELFAGYGSQALALKYLGVNFEHHFVCEFDKYAIKSYNAVHGTNFETSDIKNITGGDLKIVNVDKYTYIMTYSFPCQDLSKAGKQLGMSKGTRSGLLLEVGRLLNETKQLPQILLMENVPQVHGKKNKADFDKWLDFLKSKGYQNFWQDLNAKDFGIPQNRKRCYMVSILGDYKYTFPNPIELTKVMKDYLDDKVDDKYYLSSEVSSKFQLKDFYDNSNVIGHLIMDKWHDCIKRIYDVNKYAPTINTCQGGNREPKILHNGKIRKLTPIECFRLMGVKDDDSQKMLDINSNTQCYKQAGNSIVVQVLMAIFKQLL